MATFRRVACRLTTLPRSLAWHQRYSVTLFNKRTLHKKEHVPLQSFHTSCTSRTAISAVENGKVVEDSSGGGPTDKTLNNATMKYMSSGILRGEMFSKPEVQRMINHFKGTCDDASTDLKILLLLSTGKCLADIKPSQRMELTKEVWNLFKNKGMKLQTKDYNCLMEVYIQNEHLFSPDEILSEMHENGIEADMSTYLLMIDAYCEAGDIVGASVVAKMRREHFSEEDDTKTLLSVIKGYFRANQLDEAKNLLTSLRKSDRGYLSKEAYFLLMKLYTERGDIESMKEIKTEAEVEAGEKFDSTHFVSLIDTMRRFGQLHNLDKVIELTKNWLTIMHNHEFVKLCAQMEVTGHENESMKLLEVINSKVIISKDSDIQRLLKVPIMRKMPVEELLTIVRRLYPTVSSPDFYQAAVAAYNYKQTDYALEILNFMKQEGYVVKPQYFYPAILHYSNKNSRKDVLRVVNQMLSVMDIGSIPVAKQVVGRALDKNGKWNNLQDILKDNGILWSPDPEDELKRIGVDRELVNLINHGQLEEAVTLVVGITQRGQLKFQLKDILIKQCIKTKDWSLLKRLLLHFRKTSDIRNCNIDVNRDSVMEEASGECKQIFITELEKVLEIYTTQELQLALSKTSSPTVKDLIRKHLYLQSDTTEKAEALIPDSELPNFSPKCLVHKAVLHLQENQVEKAVACLPDYNGEKSNEQEGMLNYKKFSECDSLDELEKYISESKFIASKNAIMPLRHWIRCVCNRGKPEEVYPIVERLVQQQNFPSPLYRDFLLGYIARNDAALVLEAFKIILDTQMRSTTGSHYVLEYLNSNGHDKELLTAFDLATEMLGEQQAVMSIFYAGAFKDFTIPKFQQVLWDPASFLIPIFNGIKHTLQMDGFEEETEKFLLHALQKSKSNTYTRILFKTYVSENKLTKAVELMSTFDDSDVILNEGTLSQLMSKLVCRNRDFGLSVPKIPATTIVLQMIRKSKKLAKATKVKPEADNKQLEEENATEQSQ